MNDENKSYCELLVCRLSPSHRSRRYGAFICATVLDTRRREPRHSVRHDRRAPGQTFPISMERHTRAAVGIAGKLIGRAICNLFDVLWHNRNYFRFKRSHSGRGSDDICPPRGPTFRARPRIDSRVLQSRMGDRTRSARQLPCPLIGIRTAVTRAAVPIDFVYFF